MLCIEETPLMLALTNHSREITIMMIKYAVDIRSLPQNTTQKVLTDYKTLNEYQKEFGHISCILRIIYTAGAQITKDIYKKFKNHLPEFIQDDYRPRSEGDNVLGSVRPSVCPYVRLSVSQHSHG